MLREAEGTIHAGHFAILEKLDANHQELAKKIYLRINQFVGGWESPPTTFWAIVPASP
jgi:hypothetical protein